MTALVKDRPLIIIFDHDARLVHEVMKSLHHDSWQIACCRNLDEAHALAREKRPAAAIGCWPGRSPSPDSWTQRLRSAEYRLLNEVPLLLVNTAGRPPPATDAMNDIRVGDMLTLPQDTPFINQRLERLIQGRPSPAVHRILLAMPAEPAVDALHRLFATGGHEVCHEARLPSAERAAPFDAVIVDLDLGTAPHAALAAVPPPGNGSVLLVVTSEADPGLALVSVQAGAFAHVRKPYTADYLHHLCQEALARRLDHHLQTLYQRRIRELLHAQSLLASLLDAPGNLAVLADPAGRVVSANHAALQVCRDVFGAELVLGRSAATWLPSPVWRQLRRDTVAATRARSHRGTLELRDPPGRRRWFDLTITPVRSGDGHLRHLAFHAVELTERHLAEVELKASQQRLQALFDHSDDAIVLLDDAGSCLEANPAACQLTGCSHSEMVGQALVAFAPEEKSEAFTNQFAWFLIAGKMHTDLSLRRADGALRRVECHAIANIQPSVHLAIIRDVTEKRAMEEQLAHHQRLESVGRLASGVAHSLNNILTPLLMVPDMLRALPQAPQAFSLLQIMETGARRGANVVRQLMAFSQAMPGDKRPLNLVDLLHQTVTAMMETFPREITWDWTPLSEPCLVSGNAEQLRQVLVELLINSRDAMPRGGRLAVTLRPRQLRETDLPALPREARTGHFLELAVADQGNGIAPEALDKIFDPFFTTKPFGHGSGLGLSTALGLVKEHGGFIQVQSRSSRGTVVRVFVPALPGIDSPSDRPPGPLQPGDARTILVVDDEDWIRDLARTVLMHSGYKVVCAPHVDAAFFQVQKLDAPPDLLITDLSMPGMTGQEFIPRFHQRYPAVPIMVMTGLNLEQALAEEVRALVIATIPKPFTGPQLRARVETALGATQG